MRKLGLILALVAGPAAASGIEIEVDGAHTNGTIKIDLLEETAPNHVARITQLANDGFYDGVFFHRVIDGFMAQTGDGEFGKSGGAPYNPAGVGTGGSSYDDLAAEFSELPFERGVVGMARSQDPNSANSQFFIMFDEGAFLNGKYTVVGRVTEGLDVLDNIKRGDGSTFSVTGTPDVMRSVKVTD